ncbi:unnamed protein product [Chrysodeixis includens]|uniref:Uncharacterized protein n=1 Tax=Chrysodeixis includens TaxID=689277 RepID=A0A9N8PYR0_CHRIL|nr:unnamed protein product [Chrysodeixis includens]
MWIEGLENGRWQRSVPDSYWLSRGSASPLPIVGGHGNALANYREPRQKSLFLRGASSLMCSQLSPVLIKRKHRARRIRSLPLSSTVNFSKTTAVGHLRWLKKRKLGLASTPCSGTDRVVR